MNIEAFVFIISAIVLILSLFSMINIFGKNILLTMPGYFYIHFLVFIFLGSPIYFLNKGAINIHYIVATNLVLIILPIGIALVNKIQLWLTVLAVPIIFLCASCGSETNKETVAEVPKITKTSFQASPATIKEVIVPPTLSLIESPALNEKNLIAFGFRSSKAG